MIRNIPWKNLSNFLSVVLDNIPYNIDVIENEWVIKWRRTARKQGSNQASKYASK